MFKKILIFIILVLVFHGSAFCSTERESFALAENAYSEGLYSTSLKLFENFLIHYPESELLNKVKLFIAKSLHANGNGEKAVVLLNELEKHSDPELQQEVYYYLAVIAKEQGDFELAKRYLLKESDGSFSENQLYFNGLVILAQVYELTGNLKDSIDLYSRVIDSSDDRRLKTDAYVSLAGLYYSVHNDLELNRILDRWEKDLDTVDETSRLFYFRAEFAKRSGQVDSAIHLYNRAFMYATDGEFKDSILASYLVWCVTNGWHDEVEKYLGQISGQDIRQYVNSYVAFYAGEYSECARLSLDFIKKSNNKRLANELLLLCADSWYELGRINDALNYYNRFLNSVGVQYDLEFVERAKYGLGLCYLKKKDFQRALKQFEGISDKSVDQELRNASYLKAAAGYFEQGQVDEALRIYKQILDKSTDWGYDDYVLYQIATIHLQREDYEQALNFFDKLEERNQDSLLKEEVIYHKAFSYYMMQEYSIARDILISFIALHKESDYIAHAIALLIRTHLSLGDNAAVETLFLEFESDVFNSLDLGSTLLKEKGRYYLQINQPMKAIKEFETWIKEYEHEKDASEVMVYLANAYYDVGEILKSEQTYTQVVKKFPKDINIVLVRANLAQIYIASGKPQEAEKILLLNVDSGDEDVMLNAVKSLEDLYIKQNRFESAILLYDRVSKNYPYLKAYFASRYGYVFQRKGDFRAAIEHYMFAIDNGSVNEDLYFNLAFIYERQGKFSDAMKKYRDIVYLYSQSKHSVVKAYLRMAKISLKLNDDEEAKDIYQRLVDLDVPESIFAKEQIQLLLKK